MTLEEQLAQAIAENKALREAMTTKVKARALSFKVQPKGTVSVYGLGRFPVSLYPEQWIKLLACHKEIGSFLEGNRSVLKAKNGEGFTTAIPTITSEVA